MAGLRIASPDESAAAAEALDLEELDRSQLAGLGTLFGMPWTDRVSPPLLAALAEIPVLEEDAFDVLVARWQAVAAFDGGDAEDVAYLLQRIGEGAQAAQARGKTLVLYEGA